MYSMGKLRSGKKIFGSISPVNSAVYFDKDLINTATQYTTQVLDTIQYIQYKAYIHTIHTIKSIAETSMSIRD
jgi:hypothetical protein